MPVVDHLLGFFFLPFLLFCLIFWPKLSFTRLCMEVQISFVRNCNPRDRWDTML
jgi:hypothetical protein